MNEAELTDLSRLCDGELDNEELVRVLLDVLDSPEAKILPQTEAQRLLCDLLRLRRTTASWRRRHAANAPVPPAAVSITCAGSASSGSVAVQPAAPCVTSSPIVSHRIARRMAWAPGVGACVAIAASSAILVLAGVMVGQRLQRDQSAFPGTPLAGGSPTAAIESEVVPAERRRQLAQVFAFHESVAGPLHWYAAGEQAQDLAIASSEPQAAPVGLVLRFTTRGPRPQSREYVIVCRDRSRASIMLPRSGPDEEPVQIRLTPTAERDRVELQYCVVLPGRTDSTEAMGLSGRRAIGDGLKTLGEFASDTDSIRVEASAWVLEGAGA